MEWGIEQFEYNQNFIDQFVGEAMLKNPKARDSFMAGAAIGMKEREPAVKLLRSLGYVTFDYRGQVGGKHHTTNCSNSFE
jgi:hypothetical protein